MEQRKNHAIAKWIIFLHTLNFLFSICRDVYKICLTYICNVFSILVSVTALTFLSTHMLRRIFARSTKNIVLATLILPTLFLPFRFEEKYPMEKLHMMSQVGLDETPYSTNFTSGKLKYIDGGRYLKASFFFYQIGNNLSSCRALPIVVSTYIFDRIFFCIYIFNMFQLHLFSRCLIQIARSFSNTRRLNLPRERKFCKGGLFLIQSLVFIEWHKKG